MAYYFLTSLTQRLPLLIILIAAIIFAIVRWRRHPSVSLMAVIGLGLYVGKVFLFTALSYSVPKIRVSMNLSSAIANHLFEALNFLNNLVWAAILIFLVAAAFTGRNSNSPVKT